jgi:hypothetical protein
VQQGGELYFASVSYYLQQLDVCTLLGVPLRKFPIVLFTVSRDLIRRVLLGRGTVLELIYRL